jgi:hypothetical protein
VRRSVLAAAVEGWIKGHPGLCGPVWNPGWEVETSWCASVMEKLKTSAGFHVRSCDVEVDMCGFVRCGVVRSYP